MKYVLILLVTIYNLPLEASDRELCEYIKRNPLISFLNDRSNASLVKMIIEVSKTMDQKRKIQCANGTPWENLDYGTCAVVCLLEREKQTGLNVTTLATSFGDYKNETKICQNTCRKQQFAIQRFLNLRM